MSAALSMGPLLVLALIGRRVAPPVAVRVKWITRAGSATRVLHPELEQQILGEALAGAVCLTFELVVELADAVEDRLALERGELGGGRPPAGLPRSAWRAPRAR